MKVSRPAIPATRKVLASSTGSALEIPHIAASRTAISTAGTLDSLDRRCSITAIQWTSLSESKKNFRPTIAKKAPPKPAMPICASSIRR